jgi:hypothetical protein
MSKDAEVTIHTDLEGYEQIEHQYARNLTDNELADYKSELSRHAIDLKNLDDELKEFRRYIKEKKEPIQNRYSHLVETLEKGTVQEKTTARKVPNYAENTMQIIEEQSGMVLETREIYQHERQMKIT